MAAAGEESARGALPAQALASLAVGAAGSALAVQAGRRLAEEDTRAQEGLQERGRFVRDVEPPERDSVRIPA